jgi:hypothetical protein
MSSGSFTSLFSDAQQAALIDTAFALSLVSLLGSAFILLSVASLPKLQTFAFRLIAALALSNVGLDTAFLLGNPERSDAVCLAQGLMRVYFSIVGFFITTAITLTCYNIIIKRDFSMQDSMKKVMALCWGIPLIMALLPLTTGNYGDVGAWCSISTDDIRHLDAGTVWRFLMLYIPMWVSVCVNFWMHFQVSKAIRGLEFAASTSSTPASAWQRQSYGSLAETKPHSADDEESPRQKTGQSRSLAIINHLRMYPVALLVCWFWAFVNGVYEVIYPTDPLFWLYLLQYIFQTLNGAINAAIFLWTPSVRFYFAPGYVITRPYRH